MRWRILIVLILCGLFGNGQMLAADLDHAPPPFHKDGLLVPIDIQTVSVEYVFDYLNEKAIGTATVRFTMGPKDGYPLFDLLPDALSLAINDEVLPPARMEEVEAPESVTTLRTIRKELAAGSHNELRVSFDISDEVTFNDGKVQVGFFMGDLSDRSFFEQYGPANFEYDQIAFEFKVAVVGTATEHRIFANGDVSSAGTNSWTVTYPHHFTSSSLYFHLNGKDSFETKDFVYQGMTKTIPVTIYSRDAYSVSEAYDETLKTMKTLEEKLGPYAHDQLVIYVAGSGGMEYAGATMTSLYALAHELTHSWYARGVMPANGNSGWMDEAIASWQDDDFPTADSEPSRSPVNLSNFSPYKRATTREAYTLGKQLISEFDHMFQNQGGMLELLRNFFLQRKGSVVVTEDFHRYLEAKTGKNLEPIFDRYVYGKHYTTEGQIQVVPERYVPISEIRRRGHPTPYTRDELIEHR